MKRQNCSNRQDGKLRVRHHFSTPSRRVSLKFHRLTFGGYFQWVLDAACETVEWPYQPLGFDSLALRMLLDFKKCSLGFVLEWV